jgi:hypothetical protein
VGNEIDNGKSGTPLNKNFGKRSRNLMYIIGKTVLMGGMAALRGGHEKIPRFDIGGWYKAWPRFALAMPSDKTVNGYKF